MKNCSEIRKSISYARTHHILWTFSNGLMLDGFLSSASMLIACEQLERVCYGVEIEPNFVDAAVMRYVQSKDGKTSDVFVIRDGQRLTLEECIQDV